MDAIEEAKLRLDEVKLGLFEAHLDFCENSCGLVYLGRECVFLGASWDPVGGDHQRTLAVMYVHGDAGTLPALCDIALARGYTHVVWNRDVSRGDRRLRKEPMARFRRVCKAMCCHG